MIVDIFPSTPPDLHSHTYHHRPPITSKVKLGVDEAGRGPVLGPMVYAVAYTPTTHDLTEYKFDDSKVLKAEVRHDIFTNLNNNKEWLDSFGYATTSISALEISEKMLHPTNPINLNEQAHQTTIDLINKVINSGIDVEEIYVDTVGPPEKYEQKLKLHFPNVNKIKVAKKADSLFPIVSLASICAKVTRDEALSTQLNNCGSGYPSDPNTVKWLKDNRDKVFGWGPVVRYSWGTADALLEEVEVDFEVKGFKFGGSKWRGLPRVGMGVWGEKLTRTK